MEGSTTNVQWGGESGGGGGGGGGGFLLPAAMPGIARARVSANRTERRGALIVSSLSSSLQEGLRGGYGSRFAAIRRSDRSGFQPAAPMKCVPCRGTTFRRSDGWGNLGEQQARRRLPGPWRIFRTFRSRSPMWPSALPTSRTLPAAKGREEAGPCDGWSCHSPARWHTQWRKEALGARRGRRAPPERRGVRWSSRTPISSDV